MSVLKPAIVKYTGMKKLSFILLSVLVSYAQQILAHDNLAYEHARKESTENVRYAYGFKQRGDGQAAENYLLKTLCCVQPAGSPDQFLRAVDYGFVRTVQANIIYSMVLPATR